MAQPTIRDDVLDAWRSILKRHGCDWQVVDALALELEAAAEGRGARLPRHPRPEDPRVAGLQLPPADAVRRAEQYAEFQAARAAIRTAAQPGTEQTQADGLPPIPEGN